MASLKQLTEDGEDAQSLRELALILANAIDLCEKPTDLANLSRQYRETVKALHDLKPGDADDDDADLDSLIASAETTRPRRAD